MSALRLINETSATSVSNISVTDIFSADFDIYKIVVNDVTNASANTFNFRFINSSGSVVSASNYDYADLYVKTGQAFTEFRGTNQSYIMRLFDIGASEQYGGLVCYVFNPFSTSSYSFILYQSMGQYSITGGHTMIKGIGVLKQTASMSGINILHNGFANFSATVKTYGLRVDNG